MFIVQGLYSGGAIVGGTEQEFSTKRTALEAARSLLKDRTFEGKRVRVITADGDLVWDSQGEKGSRSRFNATRASRRGGGDHLFDVKIRIGSGVAKVSAYESRERTYGSSHTRLDLELTWKGRVLFPRGQLWIGIPGHQSIDGPYAERAAASTFSIKPGDTDRDFFDGYSKRQLEFVSSNGDEIAIWCEDTYGEE